MTQVVNRLITVGQTFPQFKKTAAVSLEKGNEFKTLTNNFANDEGRWTVMFWWPKDFTFVCPTEIAEFNTAYDDPAMKAAIDARRNGAIRGLEEYAFDEYNKEDSVIDEMSIEEYAAKADSKQLKIGAIVKVGGFLHVYTGIPDIYNGQVFYDFKIGSN